MDSGQASNACIICTIHMRRNRKSPEDKLRAYMDNKYEQNNVTTLLNMVQNIMKENEELKERVAILEQILHMHLPIIEN